MADDLDVDDLLEAPYQKVKTEESEVNIQVLTILCKNLARYYGTVVLAPTYKCYI